MHRRLPGADVGQYDEQYQNARQIGPSACLNQHPRLLRSCGFSRVQDVEGQPRTYQAVAVTRSGQSANHLETVGKDPDLLWFKAFVLHPLEDEISDFGFAPGRTFDIAQIERQSDEFVSVKLDLQLMQSIVDARNTERAMLAGALPVH
jgi:hypothetical protein